MSRKRLVTLWIITAIVALLLAATTVRLAARARSQAVVGRTVYLLGPSGAIKLYREPDPDSPISAALIQGSEMAVLEVMIVEGRTWYYVQKPNMAPGWVPAEQTSMEPPR